MARIVLTKFNVLSKDILHRRDMTTSPSRSARNAQAGMTIIEMMVVIIIVSILTTLGITGYQKLVYQARNAEAYQFLGSIRGAQQVYYETFSEYVGTEAWAEWPPGPYPTESRANWGDEVNDETWQTLGIRPDGPVWFKYRVKASTNPASAPINIFRQAPTGPWFQAQARGDFDGDGDTSLFEITSARSDIFSENENE